MTFTKEYLTLVREARAHRDEMKEAAKRHEGLKKEFFRTEWERAMARYQGILEAYCAIYGYDMEYVLIELEAKIER